MPTRANDPSWRAYTDPHGFFRLEIPAGWRALVSHSDGPFTHIQQGHVWHGMRLVTAMHPPAPDARTPDMHLSIRIEHYEETPPPLKSATPELPEPTDARFLRTYPIVHERDWISWTTSHLRLHIQYAVWTLPRGASRFNSPPLPPLASEERDARLALIAHMVHAFELKSIGLTG